MLLAGWFSLSTATVAVWLREIGAGITLRALRTYQTSVGPVVSVSAVFPTPSVEEFTVSPLLAERKRRPIVAPHAPSPRYASGALQRNADLRVLAAGPDGDRLPVWAADAKRDRAVWTGTPSRPLRWAGDEAAGLGSTGNFSVTGLVRYLYGLAGAAEPPGAATARVVTREGRSLADLAGTGTNRTSTTSSP